MGIHLGVSRGFWACQEEECSVKTNGLCSGFTSGIIYATSIAVGARGGALLRISQLCRAQIVAFQGYPENGTLRSHSQLELLLEILFVLFLTGFSALPDYQSAFLFSGLWEKESLCFQRLFQTAKRLLDRHHTYTEVYAFPL